MKWHKGQDPSSWYSEINGNIIAIAVKTGTHLDDYPWDWYFTDYAIKKLGIKESFGVSDTLKRAKQLIEDIYD